MKCRFFCALRHLQAYLCLMLVGAVLLAQDSIAQPSKTLNPDKKAEEQVVPDIAASYYHFTLSKLYEDQDDIPRALSEMQIALKYNPTSSDIHMELAGLLDRSENVTEAIEQARNAARLDSKNPDPHWFLANIYFRTPKRGEAAKESLKKAIGELEIIREMTPSDARVYYTLGGAYFELNEPEKAIQAYEKFQSLSPSNDIGFREIAKYYGRAGDKEKAVEYLIKALNIQPDSVESLTLLGNLYLQLQKIKESVPIYKKLLELSGNSILVGGQLAPLLVETGEYKDAVDILKNLIKARPSEKAFPILLGRAQIGMRKLPEAIETFKAIIEADPENLEAEFYLGIAYADSGKYAEAENIFSGLVDKTLTDSDEAKTNHHLFQQQLAAVYVKLEEYEKAIAVYRKLAETEPSANLWLLDTYLVSRQFDKGISLGKQLCKKDRSNVAVCINYAYLLSAAGKSQDSIEILSRIIQSNPQNINFYIHLSRIYLDNKRYSDAKEILRRAESQELDDESEEKLKFQYATIYERQKDYDRAESIFKEILKTNPDNATVLNYLGYMLADRGVKLEEAMEHIKKALDIDPYNGAFLDSLGWAYFKLNDMENAEKYLLKAKELIRNDSTIDDHLGDLYFKTGNLQKANDFWTKSILAGTEPEDIQKIRQKLDAIQKTLKKQKSGK